MLNLLSQAADSTSSSWELQGFSFLESNDGHYWRWGMAPDAVCKSRRGIRHGWRLHLSLRLQKPADRIQIFWNETLLADFTATAEGILLSGSWEVDDPHGGSSLRFHRVGWEAPPRVPGADERPLGFLVERGLIEPAFHTEGRVCPNPFSRIELYEKPFVPCCLSWLTEDYFSLEAGDDPWNGPAAQALRASMYDGSYRYCRLDRCRSELFPKEELVKNWSQPPELIISPENLKAIGEGSVVMPGGPSTGTLRGEERCNLACGSCRTEKITSLNPQREARLKDMEKYLDLYRSSIRYLHIAGDGEVFFSPVLRSIVKEANHFPQLELLDILTNGLLFDGRTLEELRPGSEHIRKVSVSLDAGDENTYAKVRGGDWNRLLKNLEWMAGLRSEGRFSTFILTYTLRAANFRSLPDFLNLAERLGVDEVYVSRIYDWDRMKIDFDAESVHDYAHPEHGAFAKLWTNERAKERPFRWRTNIGTVREAN